MALQNLLQKPTSFSNLEDHSRLAEALVDVPMTDSVRFILFINKIGIKNKQNCFSQLWEVFCFETTMEKVLTMYNTVQQV